MEQRKILIENERAKSSFHLSYIASFVSLDIILTATKFYGSNRCYQHFLHKFQINFVKNLSLTNLSQGF